MAGTTDSAPATALAGLCALALGMGIGRFAYTPVLPAMQADLGLSVESAGLIASANFAGYLAGALLAIRVGAAWRRAAYVAAVLASVATTLAMAGLAATAPIALARMLSGVASAFVLVHGSSIVLDRLARARRPELAGLLYAGVGVGIALSALIVEAAARAGAASGAQWLALGAAAVLLAIPALRMRDVADPANPARDARRDLRVAALPGHPVVPAAPTAPTASTEPTEPTEPVGLPAPAALAERQRDNARSLAWLTAAYGGLGFGYVITVTFIVVMVRGNEQWRAWEMLVWLAVGLSAAPSNYLWQRVARSTGPWRAMIAAFVLEAIGVIAAASASSLALVLVGAILLGGTFVGITALGLTTARELSGPTGGSAIATMTAAFGAGQIVGPAVGGWLAELSAGFWIPSLVAAAVLLASAAMVAEGRPRETPLSPPA